jgi:hypothetical protein
MICSSAEFAMDGMYICGIDGDICYDPELPCGSEDCLDDYDEDEWENEE